MPRGLFQMGTLGWTPAAQLATQNQSGAAASYASMDKAVNQTQTTKVSGGSSNIFGDILPVVGAAAGFALGGANPLAGMALGSTLGGGIGSAIGGQSAATLGGLGTLAAGTLSDMSLKSGEGVTLLETIPRKRILLIGLGNFGRRTYGTRWLRKFGGGCAD